MDFEKQTKTYYKLCLEFCRQQKPYVIFCIIYSEYLKIVKNLLSQNIKHWSAIVLDKSKQGILLNSNIFQQFSSVVTK